MNVWSIHDLSLPDTAIPGSEVGAECASQRKGIASWFSSCEMHYQQKNHYMNDSWLAGIWHYPQQTLCSKLVKVRMKTALPLLLTNLVCGLPACSSALQTFTLHVSASCVQCTMSSVGCANCTHIRLWVCCSTFKDFFWLLSSRSLRNFIDSASNSSWNISISEFFSVLGSSEYTFNLCGHMYGLRTREIPYTWSREIPVVISPQCEELTWQGSSIEGSVTESAHGVITVRVYGDRSWAAGQNERWDMWELLLE